MPLAIANLRVEIEDNHPDIEVLDTAEGVMDAAKKIKKLKPDLVFLDIHMGDGDGFDLLEISDDSDMEVIFTTASKDHAIKAFQFSALDYLLKPVDPELLAEAMAKYKSKVSKKENALTAVDTISLSTQEELRRVKVEDVIRLESSGNYTHFYIADGSKVLVTKTMKEYVSSLGDSFIRVHQSHLVNKKHIKSYIKTEGGYLELHDGSHVPVSFRKRSFVIDQLSN